MSARLQLNAHTPREILVGGVSGFIIGFVSMIVMF
jgi:membrane-associated phospholipid phosphatase